MFFKTNIYIHIYKMMKKSKQNIALSCIILCHFYSTYCIHAKNVHLINSSI